jgi:NO-binding membrane sensor protein with MHYT domain
MFSPNLDSTFNRIVFVILGLMIIGLGVASLQYVGLIYHNWWKGAVFGPFAIAIGVLFIAVMFKLGSLDQKARKLRRKS